MIAAAAGMFALTVGGAVAFQVALALGAPWGAYAMGGAFPGRFPPRMRVAAVVQAALLGLAGALVLARAGVAVPELASVAGWAIWAVVGLSAVSLVLNLITSSAGERRIWAPVGAILLITSLMVALSAP